MCAEVLRRRLNAVLYELGEVNLFPLQFKVGIVDSRRAEQTCGQIVEMIGMLIDQGHEPFFGAGQGIHFKQAGT